MATKTEAYGTPTIRGLFWQLNVGGCIMCQTSETMTTGITLLQVKIDVVVPFFDALSCAFRYSTPLPKALDCI